MVIEQTVNNNNNNNNNNNLNVVLFANIFLREKERERMIYFPDCYENVLSV